MPKYWFDHVHLNGSTPLETAEYYEKLFGATRVRTQDMGGGLTIVALDLNGTIFVITNAEPYKVTTSDGKTISGLEHYCIRTDNIEVAVAEMKKAGVKFVREIAILESGTKYTHFIAHDNVIVELLERPK